MGRRLTTTADHPWLASDGHGAYPERKLAEDLTTEDWVPIALGTTDDWDATSTASIMTAVEAAQIDPERLIVRPAVAEIERIAALPLAARRAVFERASSAPARTGEVRRTGTMRLDEAQRAEVALADATAGTTKNGTHARSLISLDDHFWRVLGLYLAEGCVTADGDRRRIQWSFHPTKEQHLVDEVAAFWLRHNVRASTRRSPTAHTVSVSSRLLAAWWSDVMGLGRGSYTQRLPDLIWERPASDRWALLSGLFEGDGSWSLVNGGPSVVVEFGTVSDELADGVLRLLASVGIVASRRVGRGAKSTKDTHWIRISGAHQVQRAIRLVPERDRQGVLASIARQRKRTAPTGYRRVDDDGVAWVRINQASQRRFQGSVYSLEVPYSHTFVSSGGLTVSNCFPKDVTALKQLAGNSGYHFQLLTAVIEVNELQKRRVIAKLQKHLGSLVGRRIALLGLAFKPETDDMREASSLVLAARLQADGAFVRAYDPVAADNARALMPGVELAASALEAVEGADAIVVVTEWHEFSALDWSQVAAATAGRLVVDGRNYLDRSMVTAAGFTYEGIGR
jgi:hypothetical protein